MDFNENNLILKTGDNTSDRLKEHESICFLSERAGKVSLNFISYDSFGKSIDFVYTKSKLSIPFQDRKFI